MIGCFICRPSPRQCPQPKIRGMLVVFSLIAAVVGLTGASSLARCLSTVLGERKASTRPCKDRQVQKRATPPAGRAWQRVNSPPLPRSLSSKASLVNSLLDDAEIQLHVIARQQPGAERSSRLVKLAESYRPERQPKAYNMKDLGPVFQHISSVVELKAGS